jgi:tetratricopeptide (TPR) repeat protein
VNTTQIARRPAARVWIGLFVLLGPGGRLQGTTISEIEIHCPLCGETVQAELLNSTNNFGGQDPDLLQRAAGTQPVTVVPISCSRCSYSGYLDDFEEVRLEAETKERLRSGLKPPTAVEPGTPSDRIPAWIRYDLLAQTAVLRSRPKLRVADAYLRASWAVRLEAAPLARLDPELRKQVAEFAWNRRPPREEEHNLAELEILHGRKLLDEARSAPAAERTLAALGALDLLRSHGENGLAEAALALAREALDPTLATELESELRASVDLERSYQAKALGLFEEALDEAEIPRDGAVYIYLCGELERRLGRSQSALARFDEALAAEGPGWLLDLARRQRRLVLEAREADPSPKR